MDVRTRETLLPLQEVARRLGVTTKQVATLRKQGRISGVLLTPPGTDKNRHIYGYPVASVQTLLHDRLLHPRGNQRYVRDPKERERMHNEGYVTLVEAGKMLGMTTEGCAAHCRTGKLPLVKKKIRYTTRAAVEALQQERIARDVLMLDDLLVY